MREEDEMKRGKNGSELFISDDCLQNADVPRLDFQSVCLLFLLDLQIKYNGLGWVLKIT